MSAGFEAIMLVRELRVVQQRPAARSKYCSICQDQDASEAEEMTGDA